MSEWATALIAAGSALTGSLITGWYSRTAGERQAEAARHAGDRQADAMLETVRMTLEEERAVRLSDTRRQTYVRFLEAGETAILAQRTGDSHPEDRAALQRAYGGVQLEGPAAVALPARALMDALRGNRAPDDVERKRLEFVEAAREVLGAGE
jgi:hypothetical protein